MKRSNTVLLIFLGLVLIAGIALVFVCNAPCAVGDGNSEASTEKSDVQTHTETEIIIFADAEKDNGEDESSAADETEREASETTAENTINAVNPEEPEKKEPKGPETAHHSSGRALFIGDSRTVGLMEYAKISNSDFFCTVGMSVFNIHSRAISVPDVGQVTLNQLLNNKKYDKIYIMLGINEIGYRFGITVKKYGELMELIHKAQPDSKIFIQANLHVTKSRSDNDAIINNNAIDVLNSELSKLADGKSRFYLDANVLFDDANGGLADEKSADSTHLLAKYYEEWGRWIVDKTASLLLEG